MGKRKLKKAPAFIKSEKPTIPVAERQVYVLFEIHKDIETLTKTIIGATGALVLAAGLVVSVMRWL